ncbi:MAG: GAF domain-containing protein [Cyanothece sp. SIO1E1]|nr:GAF domain-containing protein [Cyanothece sp. SIO1E1]
MTADDFSDRNPEPVVSDALTTNLTIQELRANLATLSQRVAQLEAGQQAQLTLETQQKALLAVLTKIRESLDINIIFRSTAQELRHLLRADRVAIYRFEPDSNYSIGEFVAEDFLPGYESVLAARVQDGCFGNKLSKHYTYRQAWVCNDIYDRDLLDCHITILERFQVRANLVVPLFKGSKLWGLICVHQCSTPHDWQETEVEFVRQIAIHLGIALQHAEFVEQLQHHSQELAEAVEQAVKREQAVIKIIDNIRRSLDIQTIFNTTVEEVRQLLQCDRVVIYRFNPDWSGKFVAESMSAGWTSLLNWQNSNPDLNRNISSCSLKNLAEDTVVDTYLQETQGGVFAEGGIFRVCPDIYTGGFTDCYIQSLESYQARAYAIVALYRDRHLWGLLTAFQNSQPHHWQPAEVNFLCQIGGQLGVAIHQASLLEQTQQRFDEVQNALTLELRHRAEALQKEAERERALAEVIDKIRRSLDLGTIFQTATTELRQLLNADRVAIFRYAPDSQQSEGDFVSESVLPQFKVALASHVTERCFWHHAGVNFPQGEIAVIPDVYNAGIAAHQLQILEDFQIRAHLMLPLFKGEVLWGLLCIHQCSSFRDWQPGEVEFTHKIATQLGVGIQQAEFLAQTEAALEKADAANRAKSNFLAHMSHELRTPMNSVLGFAQLLARNTSLNPTQQEYLNAISRSGEHLLSLLSDVLEMSKIEAGQASLNATNFDLYRLLKNLEEMFQMKAKAKGLELSSNLDDALPQYICTDESKLRQILINLLGNAIKFTQTGQVTLNAQLASHAFAPANASSLDTNNIHLVFAVEDTGPGITSDEILKLFKPFVQASAGISSQEGTGLGLAISKQFVELLSGDIQVHSVVDQGSTFSFSIQAQQVDASDLEQNYSPAQVISLAENQPTYRILVVDDRPESRQILTHLLEPIGFEVREAETGQQAFECWQQWQPHLIWMDIQMPGMNGYETTLRIRHASAGEQPIIIALTATVVESTQFAVLDSGFNDFVSKPLWENIIFDKIAQHLDVQYLYAEPQKQSGFQLDATALNESINLDQDTLRQDIRVMPDAWLNAMHQAALSAREKNILNLAEQIPEEYAVLKQSIQQLVHDLAFETLVEITLDE